MGHVFISYRRTGGVFALLTFAAVAFAATVLTVAVAATVLIVGAAVATIALIARKVLRPAPARHHSIPRGTRSSRDTIETTVVRPGSSSDKRDLLRMDGDTG